MKHIRYITVPQIVFIAGNLQVWNLLCHNCLYLDDVLNVIHNEGFTILMQRQIVLSEEEARTVCKIHENEEYFDNLIGHMTR